MSQVASKNLYDLLGNDPEEDSDREPAPPGKAIDKTLPRTAKRNAPDTAPAAASRGAPAAGERGGRGGRRGGFTGSEDAFRDRAAGSVNNRGKPADDGLRHDRHSDRLGGGRDQGSYEGRGGRGSRGGRGRGGARGDRQSRTPQTDSEKQVSQGWGSTKGDSEWNDEQAGEAIAKAEEKADGFDSNVDAPVDADGSPITKKEPAAAAEPEHEPEPEDHTKSYADYMAEQAQKKLDLGTLEVRKPNENVKQDKKWGQAKEIKKVEEEEAYIAGAAGKAKRERQRKEKTVIDIDQRFVEPQRGGHEGGRGGRGGRGRGEGRGDFRGDRGRGGPGRGRGGGGGGGGGEFRGGRGGRGGGAVNVSDKNAFPSLGGS